MSSWLVAGGGEIQLDDDVKGVALRLEYPRVPCCMRRVSLPPPRLHCRSVVVPVLSGEVARVYCPVAPVLIRSRRWIKYYVFVSES